MVFIEVHNGDTKILVSVERISYLYNAGEKTTIAFGGDKWITADESYEEIVWKIAEGERVVAVEESKKATRDTRRTKPLGPGF